MFHQLIEYFVSHRIHGFLRLSSSQEVSLRVCLNPQNLSQASLRRLAQCLVTDSTSKIGVVPRRGEGVDRPSVVGLVKG